MTRSFVMAQQVAAEAARMPAAITEVPGAMAEAAASNAVVEDADEELSYLEQPSDKVLLKQWLLPRVQFGTSHPHTHDADPYSSAPDILTTQYIPLKSEDGDKAWYFYTILKPKSSTDSRVKRSVQVNGVNWKWHMERKHRPVYSAPRDGRLLGYLSPFSFCRKGTGSEETLVRNGWLMTEYLDLKESQLALCKVYFSPPRKRKSCLPHPPTLQEQLLQSDLGTHSCLTHEVPKVGIHIPDDQLLMRFLEPKVDTRIILHEVANVYDLSPVTLLQNYEPTVSEDARPIWYFFTKANSHTVPESASRWLSQMEPQLVKDSYGKEIGYKQELFFCEMIREDAVEEDKEAFFLDWLMVELRLKHVRGSEVALCKLLGRPKSVHVGNNYANHGNERYSGPSKRNRHEKSQKPSAARRTVSSISIKQSAKADGEKTKSSSFTNIYGLQAKEKIKMSIDRGFSDEDEEEVRQMSGPVDLKDATHADKTTREALAKLMAYRKASALTAAPRTATAPTPALENATGLAPTQETALTLALARAIH